ncbi:MAG TPA: glycosyltransferase family 2 protein [bacterium]|nr:glycosyltransferase family 2 protein [bacterium]
MNPKIIIILPVHNRRAITQRFLECLNDQSYTNWHLILIDDGCTDGTAEMAQSLIKNITILKGNGNLWWAGSLQFAYRYIRKMRDFKDNDIVLIINDDVEISDVFIKNAVDIFMHNADRKILLQAIAYEKDGRKVYKTGVFYNHKHNCFNMTSDSKEINCF